MNDKDTIEIEKPKVLIPLESYRKIMAYAQECELEISGFADVLFDQERYAFVVGDVHLLKQEVSGGDTDIDEEDLSNFMVEMIESGRMQLPRLWWHSHVRMGAFFSAIDTNTMKTAFRNNSFMVALVVNKHKDMKAMLEVFAPFPFTLEDIPVKVELGYPDEVPQEIKDEVAEKVTAKTTNKFFWDKEKETEGEDKPRLYLPFPKKARKALKMIQEKNLAKAWDVYRAEYIWLDKKTGNAYLDTYNNFDNGNLPLDRDTLYGKNN